MFTVYIITFVSIFKLHLLMKKIKIKNINPNMIFMYNIIIIIKTFNLLSTYFCIYLFFLKYTFNNCSNIWYMVLCCVLTELDTYWPTIIQKHNYIIWCNRHRIINLITFLKNIQNFNEITISENHISTYFHFFI